MNWQDVRVFISGGTGFVGSWILHELLEKGAKITVLSSDTSSTVNHRFLMHNKKNCSCVIGSIDDSELVNKIFAEHEIEFCFHLAARTLTYSGSKNPLQTFSSNVAGTWSVLEACRNAKNFEGLVFASNAKVYGVQSVFPVSEDCQLLAKSPFGVSKVCGELLVKTYYETYGLPVATARFSNIYGGGDLNFSRVIPSAVRSVLLNKNPVIRSDGSAVRDYLYISDAVDAYITLAEGIKRPAVSGQVFNFSTLRPLSVLRVVNKIIEVSGMPNLEPSILRKAVPEMPVLHLSSEKAREMLDWSDKVMLEQGLKKTLNWFDVNKALWLSVL
jgi:CDP-glucose 4,6-dehydratase